MGLFGKSKSSSDDDNRYCIPKIINSGQVQLFDTKGFRGGVLYQSSPPAVDVAINADLDRAAITLKNGKVLLVKIKKGSREGTTWVGMYNQKALTVRFVGNELLITYDHATGIHRFDKDGRRIDTIPM